MKTNKRDSVIVLFDVDGTLTKPNNKITQEMLDMLLKLRKTVSIGFVGGSNLPKQLFQIGDDVLSLFDYGFAENGLIAYKGTELIGKNNFVDYIGNETYKKLVNSVMEKFSKLDIPDKTGTFIELRSGLVNICPVGRACTQEQRDRFADFDAKHGIRNKIVEQLKSEFEDANLMFVIGGQISIDIFPKGWDKTYALRYVKDTFKEIHFFGDKTHPGGNDHEIYNSELTIGHAVNSYQETFSICHELFLNEQQS